MVVIPFLVFGSISVLFGMTIYYFLPLGLLTQNASLILEIFFLILLGMIFGLTLFAVNLRGFIERLVIYLLLFWEKKSMRTLIRKNLIAHKPTNKLTSVIYALTLGCIIFLIEASNLEIDVIKNITGTPGVDIFIQSTDLAKWDDDTGLCTNNCLLPEYADPVLVKYKDHIKSFGWKTM